MWSDLFPLHDAVVSRDNSRLRELLFTRKNDLDINAGLPEDGISIVTKFPSSRGKWLPVDGNTDPGFFMGDTPLHLAVFANNLAVCQILLAHGANPCKKRGRILPIVECVHDNRQIVKLMLQSSLDMGICYTMERRQFTSRHHKRACDLAIELENRLLTRRRQRVVTNTPMLVALTRMVLSWLKLNDQ